jgi:hypothetical protein
MQAWASHRTTILLLVLLCIALVVSWIEREPSGVLAVVAVVSLIAPRWLVLVSPLALGAGLALVPDIGDPSAVLDPASLRQVAVLTAVGLVIAGAIAIVRFASPGRVVTETIVEGTTRDGWIAAPDGRATYIGSGTLEYLRTTNERLGRHDAPRYFGWQDVLHPDDVGLTTATFMRCLASGEDYNRVHRLRGSDGVYRWFRSIGVPIYDGSGQIVRWQGTTIMIEDEVRAKEDLLAREKELRLLIDTMPALVWRTGADGKVAYINQRLSRFAGLGLADLDVTSSTRLHQAMLTFIHPDDREIIRSVLENAFATGQPAIVRHRLLRADGVYRWVEARAEPLFDGDRIVQWYGVYVDIDDEKRAQEALRAAQDKLARAAQAASLAELSASIAHEINQPLAAIITTGQVLKGRLSAEMPNLPALLAAADRMIRDAGTAADVVARTRSLFNREEPVRVATSINDLVIEVRHLMSDELSTTDASIEMNLASDLPPVSVDRVQIQQVLVNLIRNALDAQQQAGQNVAVQVRSRRPDAETVCIEVRDRGSGVSDPESIFEPFFTTKPKGMGIGLAVSRTIMEAHNGRLWTEPNEPSGSAFIVALPVGPSRTSAE